MMSVSAFSLLLSLPLSARRGVACLPGLCAVFPFLESGEANWLGLFGEKKEGLND